MSRRARVAAVFVLVGLAAALVPLEADARPGGGSSFRGGSSSRSSGGSSRSSGGSGWSSGGGGGGIGFLFASPTGILIFIIIVVFFIALSAAAKNKRKNLEGGWSTGYGGGNEGFYTPPPPRPQASFFTLRSADPDFSRAVFEDFAYAIYTAAHLKRAEPAPAPQSVQARQPAPIDRLAAYLSETTRRSLASMGRNPVAAVVIGAMRVSRVDRNEWGFSIAVEFESNIAERAQSGEVAWYVREEWTFVRKHGVKSRPPERARTLDCPNCGAALDQAMGAKCRYCSQVLDRGDFDWVVNTVRLLEREQRGPMLTGTTEEEGTDRPPVFDRNLQSELAQLQQRDPQFSQQGFIARVSTIYSTMLHAWSSLEWHLARPFLSDNLHEGQSYWIDAYRRQGLRNEMKDPRLLGVQIVKVGHDRYFDSVTVRLEATGCDYTVRVADGRVVGGSKSRPRRYAEYWTLIRSAKKRGPAIDSPTCPNCGAPLANVNMAGNCGTCKVKVNSGEFDWVLARIEQDEVYVS